MLFVIKEQLHVDIEAPCEEKFEDAKKSLGQEYTDGQEREMPVQKKSVVLSRIKKVQSNHFDFNFESLNVFSVLQESSVLLEDVLLLKKP